MKIELAARSNGKSDKYIKNLPLAILGKTRILISPYITAKNLPVTNSLLEKYLYIIENALKALEIIKNKYVDIHWLKVSPNKSRYNLAVGTHQALTKKEYDLLKEVLL